MPDRDDPYQPMPGLVHDPEPADPVLPVALELSADRLSRSRIARKEAEGFLDPPLHLGRKDADDVGDMGRDVEPKDGAHRRRFPAAGRGSPNTSSNESPRFPDA